ncbi:MAG: ribbon-helix-helix domain-containing protein [Alphaproteobacteria bacterium]
MTTLSKKRSVRISGHATSITLEDAFWLELKAIARRQKRSLNDLISEIDQEQVHINLSSALRLYVLRDLQKRLRKRV